MSVYVPPCCVCQRQRVCVCVSDRDRERLGGRGGVQTMPGTERDGGGGGGGGLGFYVGSTALGRPGLGTSSNKELHCMPDNRLIIILILAGV